MYRVQCGVLSFAALAISGTAVLIWWWRSELKKRRAKNEASMALAAHEINQCDKSPTVEKDEEEHLEHTGVDSNVMDAGGDNLMVTYILPTNNQLNVSSFSSHKHRNRHRRGSSATTNFPILAADTASS